MQSLDDLQNNWYKIVDRHETEAKLAWYEVEVEVTDREGEAQYLRDLISLAESYILTNQTTGSK